MALHGQDMHGCSEEYVMLVFVLGQNLIDIAKYPIY